ncbi:uncharacterized protein LOC120129682 [Hibiscus syriacus]|uniref:uncharacterized protein LOC120129682 n=1 Tax=Hibiscus syriacus TaxID=106335 RepID=UPI0019235065|nr:uncharacterized protein LOC120129682 [Hibiscus syriacus]
MVEREDTQILSHEEKIEVLNLDTEEQNKEVKTGPTLLSKERKKFDRVTSGVQRRIEVYIDDMSVKEQTKDEHIENLRKLLQRLRKFQLKLNPNKYIFGVISGKLLGFVVSRKDIEVDPNKAKPSKVYLSHEQRKNFKVFWVDKITLLGSYLN